MATWTTPKTWTVGFVLPAADLNTYLRDNMNVGRGYVKTQRTAGNVTLSSTTWADIDTGTDMVLPAAAGDVLVVVADITYNLAAGSQPLIDARCVTSGTYFGSAVETNTGSGILGMAGRAITGTDVSNALFARTLVSGDISGGNVTVRMRYRVSAATSQTLGGVAASPFTCFLQNRGPAVNV